MPKTTTKVRSFHGLASFYRQFFWNYSSIVSPLTELIKKNTTFVWNEKPQKIFDEIKAKLTSAPVLALTDFDKTFELQCDASRVGINEILM